MTILVTSQHIVATESVADQILYFEEGRQVFCGPVDAIGAERRQNVYHVQCDAPLPQLHGVLTSIPGVNIAVVRRRYRVATPPEVAPNELLALLVGAKIRVHSFEDISRSTLSFWNPPR
jgi:ABC-type multidrug transport system ATPase subunit